MNFDTVFCVVVLDASLSRPQTRRNIL